MSAAKREAGPVSARVAANVRRLRRERNLSTYEMSAMLDKAGWPMHPGSITRLEGGERRVDADDLIALALVLGVSPNALLLPQSRPWLVQLQTEVWLTPGVGTNLGGAWGWATGEMAHTGIPLTLRDEAEFALDNRPHRFTPLEGPYADDMAEMRSVVRGGLANRITPWQLRTLFEQALVSAMNDLGDVPAPADWSEAKLWMPGDPVLPDRPLSEIEGEGDAGGRAG